MHSARDLKLRAKARREFIGRQGLRRRPIKWLHPINVERSYARALLALVNHALDRVLALVPDMARAVMRVHADAGPSGSDDFDLERISQAIGDPDQFAEASARRMADGVATFNKAQFKRVVKSVVGVDPFTTETWLLPLMETAVKENLALASSLTDKFETEAQGIFSAAMRAGIRAEALEEDVRAGLRDDIRARADVAESRAKLIARDQVSKLNGAMTKKRQEAIGVTAYIWRTSQDERVRPEHAEREGQQFQWDDPPEDGAPGEAINCRCTAEMVLPEDLLDEQ